MVNVESAGRALMVESSQPRPDTPENSGKIAMHGIGLVIEPTSDIIDLRETNQFYHEADFADIAETLRPTCEELDSAWRAVDQAKRTAVRQVRDAVEFAITEPLKPAVDQAGRKMRKAIDAIRTDRGHQNLVEGLSMVIRHGVREQIDAGEPVEVADIYRYKDACALIDVYLESSVTHPLIDISEETMVSGQASINMFMDEAADELIRQYSFIYKDGLSLVSGAADYFAAGLGQAHSFMNWLEKVHEEQDGDYRAYLQMLAADLSDREGSSKFGVALERLRLNANGALRREFIAEARAEEDCVSGPESKQWLAFIRSVAYSQNPELSDEEFDDLLVSLETDWPQSLKASYEVYTDKHIKGIHETLHTILDDYVVKTRQNTTRQDIDVILVTDANMPGDQRSRSAKARLNKSRQAGRQGRVTPSLKKVMPLQESEPEPAVIAVLKQTPEGFCVEADGAEDNVMKMVERYCSSHPEEGLDKSLYSLIEHVSADPFGPGTKKLTRIHARIAGKHYPLRRATIRRNGSLDSSGNTAYRTRLIYAVIPQANGENSSTVAIREVIHHNDADQKYTRNQ